MRDLRHAVRALLKNPGFTIVAVLSLGLGIGVNTTIFSLVNAVLLRPLAVAHPEELVAIYTSGERGSTEFSSSSYPDYKDLQGQNEVFTNVLGHSLMLASLAQEGKSQVFLGEVVTGNYFDLLGVRAALGRTFTSEEDTTPLAHPVAVLSDGFWKRRMGADPEVLGKTIRLNGVSYTVVGVLPASFQGLTPGFSAELWVPTMMVEKVDAAGIQDVVPSPTGTTRLDQRGRRFLFLKARLKPGVALAQARANVTRIMAGLEAQYPETNKGRTPTVLPASGVRVHPLIDSTLEPTAMLLMTVMGMVLLIACANVANLLLARATARRREIAVRLALGASRRRLVRQLLAESLVLSGLGAVFGLVLAFWTTRALVRFQPPIPIALTLDVGVDVRVLAFTVAASLVAAVAFGLLPALQASRPDLVPALKNEAVRTAKARKFGFRQALVVGQVAVSSVLLVGAMLLVRGLLVAQSTDVGFDHRLLSVFTFDLEMAGYSEERGQAFYRDAVERLRAIPGVVSVALADRLPFAMNLHTNSIFVEGRHAPDAAGTLLDVTSVSNDYFETLGIPIVRGRNFGPSDVPGSPRVAVVNDAMARRFWPGEDAIGKRFHLRSLTGPEIEIVGVVSDHKVRTVGEDPRPFIHYARSQRYSSAGSVLVRTRGEAGSLLSAIRAELLRIEPDLAFIESQTMEDEIAVSLYPARMGALLLLAAGGLALALAAVGLYGVIAYSVGRRTKEIGIRMAIGARPRAVLGLVVREGMTLVTIGLVTGLILSSLATRSLSAVLYGVSSVDALAFGVASTVLLAVALLANWIPARRAARVDPMTALREL